MARGPSLDMSTEEEKSARSAWRNLSWDICEASSASTGECAAVVYAMATLPRTWSLYRSLSRPERGRVKRGDGCGQPYQDGLTGEMRLVFLSTRIVRTSAAISDS